MAFSRSWLLAFLGLFLFVPLIVVFTEALKQRVMGIF